MKYVYVFFASMILAIVNSFLRSGYVSIGSLTGFRLAILALMISYLVFTFIVLNTNKRCSVYKLIVVILLGSSILELPLHILNFNDTLVSLPDLPCRWLAIIIAYFCYRWQNNKMRLSFLLIPYLILSFWLTFKGYDLYSHRIYFGTFTGKIIEDVHADSIVLKDESGKKVGITKLNGEYVILDFWFTGCKVCFDIMPECQRFHDSLNNDKFGFYSVCCYNEKLNEDYKTGNKTLSEIGYNFPALSINIKDPLLQNLGISSMPIVLIFNSERKLVFKGSLAYAKDFINSIKDNDI